EHLLVPPARQQETIDEQLRAQLVDLLAEAPLLLKDLPEQRLDLVVHDDPLLSGDPVEVDVRPEHRARAGELVDRRLVDAPGPRARVAAVRLVVIAGIPPRQVTE